MKRVCETLMAVLLWWACVWAAGPEWEFHAEAQSAPVGARKQKLANPLNELLDEAQREMDKKDFAAAVEPLQKFIAEQPDVAYGHFQLAYAFTALHKTAEARAEYERALAIDPKMAEAYLNLGVLLIDSDPAASVTNLRKGVDLLPAQSHPRYLLGVAQERTGDFAGATESFQGAYRLDPKNPEPIVYLANLYLRLKRFPEAEAKFRSVLEAQRRWPAILGLAECLDAEKTRKPRMLIAPYLAVQPGIRARGRGWYACWWSRSNMMWRSRSWIARKRTVESLRHRI